MKSHGKHISHSNGKTNESMSKAKFTTKGHAIFTVFYGCSTLPGCSALTKFITCTNKANCE